MAPRLGPPTRRDVVKGALQLGAAGCLGSSGLSLGSEERTPIFAVTHCPVHDGQRRHVGVDALLSLLAGRGLALYRTGQPHRWGSQDGIVAADDVVLVKVNAQWFCRGATNTDVLRGLVHRILEHPDGFAGEVVIVENGQGIGSFKGVVKGTSYKEFPEIYGQVVVNAEESGVTTIQYLLDEVFAGEPVSALRLESLVGFLAEDDLQGDGYRRVAPPPDFPGTSLVSYPCFTTRGGHHVDLRAGRWTPGGWASNVKLINLPVLKHHQGCGITGALKHCYGIVSMRDGSHFPRHYTQLGSQCGQLWGMVRPADLHILDGIFVSQDSLCGYPPTTTTRCDTLLASLDPVALDYWAVKHVLLPLGGGSASEHDPDRFPVGPDLAAARDVINAYGGIRGRPCRLGDEDLEVVSREALPRPRRRLKRG